MKYKKLAVILSVLLLAFSLFACGRQPAETSAEVEESEMEIEEETMPSETEEGTEEISTETDDGVLAVTTEDAEGRDSEGTTGAVTENVEATQLTVAEQEKVPTQFEKTADAAQPTVAPTPVHEHSYIGTVTANATCASTGVKTYTCSCGSSYTEPIPTTEHNWAPRYETVHYEAQGEMRQVQVGTSDRYLECGYCGATFATHEELNDHCANSGDFTHATSSYWVHDGGPIYEDQWVVTQEAYDEQVVVGYTCTVCGATQ